MTDLADILANFGAQMPSTAKLGQLQENLRSQQRFGSEAGLGQPYVATYSRLGQEGAPDELTATPGPDPAAHAKTALGILASLLGPRIPNPIRAYHGSPHDFDKFDLSKIGTGEGSKAYVHGLYFAENPKVAQEYRDDLAHTIIGGKPYDETNYQHLAVAQLQANKGDTAQAAQALRKGSNDYRISEPAFAARLLRAAGAVERGEALPAVGPGRMYEVALHARPEQFLDHSAPFHQMPEAAQKVLEPYRSAAAEYFKVNPSLQPPSTFAGIGHAAGDVIPGAAQKIAQGMSEAGIPGIRYLDQFSRTGRVATLDGQPIKASDGIANAAATVLAQEGGSAEAATAWLARAAQSEGNTHSGRMYSDAAKLIAGGRIAMSPPTANYVVFSPEIIEILRKYGLVGSAGAGASLANILSQPSPTEGQ